MNKLLFIAFFCLFSVLAKAEVQVEIDSTQINMDEPFQISLIQSNYQGGSAILDLTPLRKDFFILATERSVNYSIINGQSQSVSTWVVTLKALKSGTITIPSIRVGNEQSKPLTITVETAGASPNPSANNTTDNQQGIILTTDVSEKKPYVNQQITYKVSLYNSKQFLDANYEGPKVDNALLIPLGGEKRYQTQRNGRQYLVEEQTYAIFPQKSGPLKITSPVLTALVYNFEPQRVKVADKDITLNVQPIPKQYTGQEWLPAKQVNLREEYENIGQTLSQGSTLVRTVTLEGVGIPAQLLPALNFAETDAFNVYPEKGKEKNQIVQGELVSSTEIKVSYLFNKSGKVTIPELKLPWFNTTTGKEEFATLAPRSFEITPSATMRTTEPHTTQTASLSSQHPISTTQDESATGLSLPETNYWPWIFASFFAFAWLVTLGLWRQQKHNRRQGKGAYKKALNKLHTACKQGNTQEARNALLKWAREHWPDAPILNLGDLNHLINNAQLKKQIQILSQALYQDTGTSLWHGDELWRSVQEFKKTPYHHPQKTDVLPPINPT